MSYFTSTGTGTTKDLHAVVAAAIAVHCVHDRVTRGGTVVVALTVGERSVTIIEAEERHAIRICPVEDPWFPSWIFERLNDCPATQQTKAGDAGTASRSQMMAVINAFMAVRMK